MNQILKTLRLMLLAVLMAPVGHALGQTPAQQDAFDAGLAAFQRGDYGEALDRWQPLADGGLGAAQLGLGVLYFDGLGIDRDDEVAAQWFTRAAEAGNAEAQFNLGRMYFAGRGLTQDYDKARQWYEQASNAGHAEASYHLGSLYAGGVGVSRDEVLAYHRFDLAVTQARDPSVRALAESNRGLLERRLNAEQIRQAKAMTASTLQAASRPAAPEAIAQETPVAPAPVIDEAVANNRAASGLDAVGQLEAAAAEAREAQAAVDAAAARLAELETNKAPTQDPAAETEISAAAQQVAEADRQLAAEQSAETQAKQALARAEKDADDATGVLSAQRRVFGEAQAKTERLAKELADIEARRQAIRGQQVASQAQLEAAKAEVEEQLAAVATQEQLAERARQSVAGSRARTADLNEQRLAAVARQKAAAERLRDVAAASQLAQVELEEARAGLAAAREAAAATRSRLTEATLAFNRTGSDRAATDAKQDRAAPAAAASGRAEPTDVPAELVAGAQRSLASLGYDPGQADGVAGARTLSALRQFQTDNGLPVTGQVTEELAFSLAILASARAAPVARQLNLAGTGTGFVVAGDGHVLTNNHVVDGCTEVRVNYSGETYVAPHLASDISNDLALLNSAIQAEDYLAFRAGRAIRPGDDVVVLGFPLQGQLSDQVKVTRGTISALSGPDNNRTLLQTTAPVQAGSSGGPLLDLSGNVVGIVMGKISSVEVENVSFAIKAAIARIFLDAEGINYRSLPSDKLQSAADVVDQGRRFTVLVECWNE